jgi:hypothetical protein
MDTNCIGMYADIDVCCNSACAAMRDHRTVNISVCSRSAAG